MDIQNLVNYRHPSWKLFIIVLTFLQCCSCHGSLYGQDKVCIPKQFEEGHLVCICNATYCDTIQPLTKLPHGQYWTVTSTKGGQRFVKQTHNFTTVGFNDHIKCIRVNLNHSQTFQTIIGFGGAFTDAATMNIVNMSQATREHLLRSYFSNDGLEYTIGRVPIGGTDFSPRIYTYDDDHSGDFNLSHFKLQPEDLNYKIPVIQQALNMSSRPIKFFGSPWSAPAWMKTNNNITGKGTLKGKPGGLYYQTWANYFVKFLDEYKKHNITFWGLTTQNEPQDGNTLDFSFNCMGLTEETEGILIGKNLGPTLQKSGYGDIKLMILDDQTLMLPQWAKGVLQQDSDARKYVAGIAFHWYLNFMVPATLLSKTHELFPDLFLLSTEACEGSQPFERKVNLGDWSRGENYCSDIINDLQHWTSGWVDWNMCLTETGGPKWNKGADDSPIIVNITSDEFYKQPMYYALGHFSKFIPPGSVVINTTVIQPDANVLHIAVDNPNDNSTIVVVLNRNDHETSYCITDPKWGTINTVLPVRSIQTYVWWNN